MQAHSTRLRLSEEDVLGADHVGTKTTTAADPATALERQLREARLDAFVGRADHLAAFNAVLDDDMRSFTVLYLHGPGGIGKSTLLQRFADEAHETRRLVISIDATAQGDAARDLAGAAGGQTPSAARPIVLIDNLDLLQNPQDWLRATVLPAFPRGALVVVAASRPPAVAWQADPSWSGLLAIRAVDPLSGAEADALLGTQRIPDELRAYVHALCGGNPLALRVAAQLLSAGPIPEEALGLAMSHAIFDRVVGVLPSPKHRQALRVCAHALWTDEELLRATVPGADAQLFEWLRQQPFMRSDAHGIFPDGVVRNVVAIESRWRGRGQFDTTQAMVRDYLVQRARTTPAAAVLPLVANVLFVERRRITAPSAFHRMREAQLEEHGWRAGDRQQVLRMATETEGPESARLVQYWLDRQPGAFTVYRRPGNAQAVAFLCRLRLAEPTAEDLATDPVVATAWSHARRAMPLEPDNRMSIVRFCVDPNSYHGPSEAMDLMQLRCAATLMRDDSLLWTTIVTPDPRCWAPLLGQFPPQRDAGRVRVGAGEYVLVSQCWKAASQPPGERPVGGLPLTWRRRQATSFSRTEFDQAVRLALRSWRRPDLLSDSDLVRSRIVRDRAGVDAVTGIRQVLSAALETIGSDSRQAKSHRVLIATYLRGAPTQEAAAERLSLPFSTYRRHLARGLEMICDLLWKAETDAIDLDDRDHTGATPTDEVDRT
ncbi:ATP-binding protein [Nonomuraea lactucae]|uniref:ATP-binding protein n=1 Tax=Nonomuraea lactucae TaxID=2249762 RepID=UPI0013B3F3CA|nr:ATP-binding protein [Nonomuraea lactucae]